MLVPRFKPAHAAGLIAVFVACTGALLSAAPLTAQAQSSNTNAAATATPMSKAQPQGTVAFDIAAQDLAAALTEFARQSGQELIYNPASATGKVANAVEGEMSRASAMQQLLQGTGLEFLIMPSGGMMLGNPDEVQSYRAKLQSSSAEAAADATTEVAQAAPAESPLDPSLTDPGTSTEPTTANVEVSRQGNIEEIIVTGQKKAERLQDVPIAISAFSMDDLDNQKIEGGFDLLKGVPNVTFSKTNFSGYNFSIRGIGTQAVSASTDPGVAVSFNNTTLIVNRLFEQEYLDIERVEVLRGPQGTLFGRNATAGVINVISAKPDLNEFSAEIKGEIGNYASQRLRGHVNVPLINDTLALRAAYAMTQRDGFGFNQASLTNDTREFGDKVSADVDNRDLWTGRLSLGWQAMDTLRFNLIYEHFEEDDQRLRTSKQLCHRAKGASIVPFEGTFDSRRNPDGTLNTAQYNNSLYNQGCDPGSLYADEAYGTPNGTSQPFVSALFFPTELSNVARFAGIPGSAGFFGLGGNPWFGADPADAPCELATESLMLYPVDICKFDIYGSEPQSRDLRSIYSLIEPTYEATSDIVELSFDLDLMDGLVFSSQSVYVKDDYYASQDYNRFKSEAIFSDSATACGLVVSPFGPPLATDCTNGPNGIGTYANGFYANVSPGGIVCDPQLGCSDTLVIQDLSKTDSEQYNQEFRLVSSFDGDWNFSVGANFTRFETVNDYYVFSNAFTHLLNFFPFHSPSSYCVTEGRQCRYIDPNPLNEIDGQGHNYFRSQNPYKLTSSALFSEAYWQVAPSVKITAGLRFTWDRKVFTPVPSQLLLGDYREAGPELALTDGTPLQTCQVFGNNAARTICGLLGTAPGGKGYPASPDIVQSWREPTGRLVVDWKPDVRTDWLDETLLYASLARGYKGGGANPPSVDVPARAFLDRASGGSGQTFKAEYVNALEIGSKNTLFGGGLVLNGTAFYYDYTDYQVSQILDRRAVNSNFDATIWGAELEAVLAPTPDLTFNAAIGYLRTRIADGEESIDIIDRTDGGNRHFAAAEGADSDFPEGFDRWTVIRPWINASANCVVPTELLEANAIGYPSEFANFYCPAGNLAGSSSAFKGTAYFDENGVRVTSPEKIFDPLIDAPNGGSGFSKDLGGNELPNAPRFTVSLGAQQTFLLPAGWDLTGRLDWYWQDESYHRVYNLKGYDELKAWSMTNVSVWIQKPDWGLKIEAYVKNAFDESPITGAFLNSEDTALTTNVFTLDPRLVGLSITKRF